MIRVATLTFRARIFGIYIAAISLIVSVLFIINQVAVLKENIDTYSQSSNQDTVVNFVVQNGDSFSNILRKYDVAESDITSIINAMKKYYDPSKINIGQNIAMFYENYVNDEEELKRYLNVIKLSISPTKSLEVIRNQTGTFDAKEVKVQLEKYLAYVSADISNSLFSSATQNDIPRSVINEVVRQLSYDIDFQRDVRNGDKFSVIYETFYDSKGEFAMYGKPIYMSATIDNNHIEYYYFENSDNVNGDYYTINGTSVKKDLLKTPINAARISSSFGLRKHPVLGFTKMHNGVDFPAPIGTPIFAAGDGVVQEAKRKGAYGNYVRIKHNGTYATAYAHLSKFAHNIKPGSKVKQGEIVGFVGTTGRSTGPHLHYEVIQNGKHINPMSLKLTSNQKLSNKNLKQFNDYVKKVNNKILSIPSRAEISAKDIKI
jgi:murein DD-endopeptidase MepM/ murein hydrolase activator NlpD